MRRRAASMRTSRILLARRVTARVRGDSLSRLSASRDCARIARRSGVCGVESPGRMSTLWGVSLRSLDFVAFSEIMREPGRVHVVRSNVEELSNRRRSSRSLVSRAFDLIAIVAVAIVLLLPKPSLEAKPALVGEKIELDRVAALEDARFAEPDNVDHAVELADAYLRLLRPDWALATLAEFASSGDHRVHLLRATA